MFFLLADIFGRTDLNFEKFHFFDFLDPKFPDAAASAAADGRTLRSQPDPSPNAPRDQIRRKVPCCDILLFVQSMQKMPWDGPEWAPRGLFPANPDLADILGRTDLDFDKYVFV